MGSDGRTVWHLMVGRCGISDCRTVRAFNDGRTWMIILSRDAWLLHEDGQRLKLCGVGFV